MQKHLDRYALFLRYQFDLEREALSQAIFEAENYRRFNVGASILASNGKDLEIFGGANIMNGEGHPKVCAEQQALKYAFLNEYYDVLNVCVVGEPQPDKESGLVSLTLHPCGDCRKLMTIRERLSPETLIYTFTFTRNHTELHTLQDIIKRHQKAHDFGRGL